MRSPKGRIPKLAHDPVTTSVTPEISKCRHEVGLLNPIHYQMITLRPSNDPSIFLRDSARHVLCPSPMIRIPKRFLSSFMRYGILRRR